MKTSEQALFLLKTRGRQTAQSLAEQLQLTSMGVRRQLEAAQERGLVTFEDEPGKVGRPVRHWMLTEAGHARFPDRHAGLTVQIIAQVRTLFGEEALDRLVAAREQDSEALYRSHVDQTAPLAERVAVLARLRDAEGYMAEVQVEADDSVLLLENHCPICAAARTCQQFCRSELDVFQRVLGADCTVERTEHQLAGARRCAYLVRARSSRN
jgi:predicted ArsR family transcriptional regulator